MSARMKVKLLVVQISGNDIGEAIDAFAQTRRELAAAVAMGTTDVHHTETTPGGTRIRVRMKLERANTPTEGTRNNA